MAEDGRPAGGHPDIEPPLGDIPEFDRGELQSDTLAFERIKRRPPERRRRILIIVVLLVLAGGSYAGWLAMGDQYFGGGPATIPVIRAAEGPVKVRPDKPGGIEIKNRDINVYKRIGGDAPERTAEKLLPKPEAPLPAPAPETVTPAEPEPKTAEKLIAAAEAKQEAAAAKPSPEKVAALQEPLPPPPPPAVKGKTAAPPPSPEARKQALVPALAPTPPKPTTPPPAPTKPVPAASGGGYSVQLAAVRDENAARGEWRRLRSRHADLLGALSLNVVRADLGPKGIFYRLRAGDLTDKASAHTLCQALTKKKVGCLVIPPGG
ncbi:MAG: SPOR domain-containing protein [Rhodospirillaceae bacterium]|nr:SPOR domain-containing protein [Rhodospirillaceae bacterium]